MAQTNSSSDPHVAVLAFPFGTHAAPLLTLVTRLAAASPNTLFSFFTTAQSSNSIFSSCSQQMLPNIKAYKVAGGGPDGYVFVGKPEEDIELFIKVTPHNFKKGMKEAVGESGRKVSCLVSDAFLWFAKDMADENGVPWLPFWPGGASSLSSHLYSHLVRQKYLGVAGIGGREDETLNFIPGMSDVRIRDLPEGILCGNLESLFSRMLHQMGQVLPEADAVFINSFEDLDPVITDDLKSTFKHYLTVGPFNLAMPPPSLPDSHGCLAWLDRQKPASVAYISFGSVASPSPNEVVALAEALEASRVPFIWSLREKSKIQYLPNGLFERVNGIVVAWAPQIDLLAHGAVGVFISHCGSNSVQESIEAGVPMIGRPFFGDQRLNGRMVEDVWKIGVIVEGGVFTKDGIMSCLDQVLAQEDGKKMRENLKALKEFAERAVGPNGSSTQNFKALLDLICSRNNA